MGRIRSAFDAFPFLGLIGDIYGIPTEDAEQRSIAAANIPSARPRKPATVPRMTNTNCKTDSARDSESDGAANEPSSEIDTIIISSGLAMFALTAD